MKETNTNKYNPPLFKMVWLNQEEDKAINSKLEFCFMFRSQERFGVYSSWRLTSLPSKATQLVSVAWDVHRPQPVCLVHVTDHYVVWSKVRPFPSPGCAICVL